MFIQYASRKPPGLAVESSCCWWTGSSGFGSGTTVGRPQAGQIRRVLINEARALHYNPYACLFVEGKLSSSGSSFMICKPYVLVVLVLVVLVVRRGVAFLEREQFFASGH